MRNKVLELLRERERSVNWLAKKMDISHQALTYKIKHDTFSADQRYDAAVYLCVPVSELFPESNPSPEAA